MARAGVAVFVRTFARFGGGPLGGGASVAVEAFKLGFELGRKRGAAGDRLAEGEGERAGGGFVERVGHRNAQVRIGLRQRNNAGVAEEGGGQAIGGDQFSREVGGLHHGGAEQSRVGGGKVAVGNQAELGGDAVDPLAGFRFKTADTLEGSAREKAAVGEDGGDGRLGGAVGHGGVRVGYGGGAVG